MTATKPAGSRQPIEGVGEPAQSSARATGVATHEVLNQPREWGDVDLLASDPVLGSGIEREGADPDLIAEIADFGRRVGRFETFELGRLANENPPRLRTHDRYGRRIDEVEFHPAWHRLMALGVEHEVHALPWNRPGPGAHVARAAKHYLLTQAEAGVLCPLTMTFAAVPALRAEPEVAAEWVPWITSKVYDFGLRPAAEKRGVIVGMAMTEKQGGSDVRANTTRAVPTTEDGVYRLTGHKWFCSAPMSDAFLTLAQTDEGLSCFLVPRVLADGELNTIFIQRLKDKLGNRSNASSEIEYRDTWAHRLGPEGRGVPTILEMVAHTRLDCMLGSAGLMRQALLRAVDHCRQRSAFGRPLIEQPLMRNVLADLTLEWEAALTLALRVARSYDGDPDDSANRAFRRLATALGKYWVCKRAPAMVCEALECHGGGGYVEESILPRIYREAPLSSIWEGSGNVMGLDVLRTLGRDPEAAEALRTELDLARGADRRYDRHLDRVAGSLRHAEPWGARRLAEQLALALQASLLLRHAPHPVADAFCDSRLGDGPGHEYGTLAQGTDSQAILDRVGYVG